MRDVLLTVVRGLGFGSVYALLAVSFVIIYKSSKVVSFAQPALMLAGAVLVSYLAGPVGFYLAVPLAAVAIGMLGWGLERTTIRPMIGRPVFVVAIITLGLDIAIRVVVNVFIGPDVRNVGDPWGLSTVDVLGLPVQERYIAMAVVCWSSAPACSPSSGTAGTAWPCGPRPWTRRPRWCRACRSAR